MTKLTRVIAGPPPKWIFKALVRIHPTLRKRLAGIENVYKTKAWRKQMECWLNEDRAKCIDGTLALSAVDVSALSDDALLAHFVKCYENVRDNIILEQLDSNRRSVGPHDLSSSQVHLHQHYICRRFLGPLAGVGHRFD